MWAAAGCCCGGNGRVRRRRRRGGTDDSSHETSDCSIRRGKRTKRATYRYEVVYRREESVLTHEYLDNTEQEPLHSTNRTTLYDTPQPQVVPTYQSAVLYSRLSGYGGQPPRQNLGSPPKGQQPIYQNQTSVDKLAQVGLPYPDELDGS